MSSLSDTCRVTLIGPAVRTGRGAAVELPKCGLPAVAYDLCAKHYGDRLRLGGAA